MQRFRDYIYCDSNKIKSYINQISEFNKIEISNTYEKNISVNGGLDLKIAKTGNDLSKKIYN